MLIPLPEPQVPPPKTEKIPWTPVPYDPRFPNTNQTRNCYQNYLDFHRCSKVRGEQFEACQYFKSIYQKICPIDWYEKWDTQVAEGRFPGRI